MATVSGMRLGARRQHAARLWWWGLVGALAVCAGGALGSAASVPDYGARDGGPSVPLGYEDGRSPYGGIGRYVGRASCTAVFVTPFEDPDEAGAAPAYALTNGHCPDFPGANDVLLDRPPGRGQVTFNYFGDTSHARFTVPVARNAYVSMKGRDLAVLELAIRHDELRAQGIAPWPLAGGRPSATEPVVVVGAPDRSFLRLAACALGGEAPFVFEYIWTWVGALRLGCADIAPGSSGSPVLARRTGQLVGLVNTTTNGGRAAWTECVLDHPCEPAVGGETAQAATSYLTPAIGLGACFPDGRFDVRASGCPLDPGAQVVVSPAFLGRVNPTLTSVPLGRPTRAWNVTVSGVFSHYRYKVAAAAVEECRDPRGYSPPRAVADRPTIDHALPAREGWWLLCVIGEGGPRGSAAQPVSFPTVVRVRIDTVRPRIVPPLEIEENPIAWQVRFVTQDPEVAAYQFKFGRPSETRCEDAAGYRPALVPFTSLPKSGRPYVFCAIPYDAAFNPGRIVERVLP